MPTPDHTQRDAAAPPAGVAQERDGYTDVVRALLHRGRPPTTDDRKSTAEDASE
jgi:hypothetical protein